jgi:hypothetical protein
MSSAKRRAAFGLRRRETRTLDAMDFARNSSRCPSSPRSAASSPQPRRADRHPRRSRHHDTQDRRGRRGSRRPRGHDPTQARPRHRMTELPTTDGLFTAASAESSPGPRDCGCRPISSTHQAARVNAMAEAAAEGRGLRHIAEQCRVSPERLRRLLAGAPAGRREHRVSATKRAREQAICRERAGTARRLRVPAERLVPASRRHVDRTRVRPTRRCGRRGSGARRRARKPGAKAMVGGKPGAKATVAGTGA